MVHRWLLFILLLSNGCEQIVKISYWTLIQCSFFLTKSSFSVKVWRDRSSLCCFQSCWTNCENSCWTCEFNVDLQTKFSFSFLNGCDCVIFFVSFLFCCCSTCWVVKNGWDRSSLQLLRKVLNKLLKILVEHGSDVDLQDQSFDFHFDFSFFVFSHFFILFLSHFLTISVVKGWRDRSSLCCLGLFWTNVWKLFLNMDPMGSSSNLSFLFLFVDFHLTFFVLLFFFVNKFFLLRMERPLFTYAAEKGSEQIVKILIEHRSNINIQTKVFIFFFFFLKLFLLELLICCNSWIEMGWRIGEGEEGERSGFFLNFFILC